MRIFCNIFFLFIIIAIFFPKISHCKNISKIIIIDFFLKDNTSHEKINYLKESFDFLDISIQIEKNRFLAAFPIEEKLPEKKIKKILLKKNPNIVKTNDIKFLEIHGEFLLSSLNKDKIFEGILGKNEKDEWKVIGEKKEENKIFKDSFKPKDELFTIYDFSSIYNSLGGIYGKYLGKEAKLEVYQRKNFLILEGENLDIGWGGIWINLFPQYDDHIVPLDLRDYKDLIIQYKFEAGENISIKISDKEKFIIEDPFEIFNLKEEEIGKWKSLKINLKNLSLDLSNLCSLVLDLTGNSKIKLKIGNIYATKESNFLPYPKECELNKVQKERSIYFWDTIEILNNKKDWEKVIKILKKAEIKTVFIQIPYKINKEKDGLWLKKRAKKFKKFINLFVSEEIDIQFLDGWKGFALKENHHRLLAQIQRLNYFWKKSFPHRDFPPIHLDIEPYLLKEYNNENYREIYLILI